MLDINKNQLYLKEFSSYYYKYSNILQGFRNKTFFITGIRGLLGSAFSDFVYYLNTKKDFNINIISIARSGNQVKERFHYFEDDFFSFYEFDVNNEEFIDTIVSRHKNIDFIIHAASNANPKLYSEDPIGTILTNVNGTNNILKLSTKYTNCKNIYISSAESYGVMNNSVSYDETDLSNLSSYDVRNNYPLSKLAAENLCFSYDLAYNTRTIIMRLVHTFGPTMTYTDSRASSDFIRKGLLRENIILKSDGKQIRSYVYVFDVIMSIFYLLSKESKTSIYNISKNNDYISIADFADYISKLTNINVIYQSPNKNEKAGFNKNSFQVISSNKLNELGFTLDTTINDAIEKTINILKKGDL